MRGVPLNPMIIHPSENPKAQEKLLALSETNNKGTEVVLHKIGLCYHCAWQIMKTIDFADRCCKHIGEPKAPLSEHSF